MVQVTDVSPAPSRAPGRPRSERARKAILRSTIELLQRTGFGDLSIEAIAAHAGVGKATVYRWWPNKAALVIDAFVESVGEELRFPKTGSAIKGIRYQMERWTRVFRSPLGQVIAMVIGAGQSDPEILEAFRQHWVEPRRQEARELLRRGMETGEIRRDIDPDTILDIFYGPLYLRLLVRRSPLSAKFVDAICSLASSGLQRQ
jgi:AcrR family transcriptional regulator